MFLFHYLLNNGFKYVEERKDFDSKTFSSLISELGQFYQITVIFEKLNKRYIKATFFDSLKIIPMPVKQIAKSFNLSLSKLEIDYKKQREIGHELTPDEIDYIKNDVQIVAIALKTLFDKDLTKMTSASNALHDFKKLTGKGRFERLFPSLSIELDSDLRKSYKRSALHILIPIIKKRLLEKELFLMLTVFILHKCYKSFL